MSKRVRVQFILPYYILSNVSKRLKLFLNQSRELFIYKKQKYDGEALLCQQMRYVWVQEMVHGVPDLRMCKRNTVKLEVH